MRITRRSGAVVLALLATVLLPATRAGSATRWIIYPEPEELRPVLERLGDPGGLSALAINRDRTSAAVAIPEPPAYKRTRVRIAWGDSGETVELVVADHVRDLIFTPDNRLYGLVHKPAKRNPGLCHLFVIEPGSRRTRRLLRVHPTAQSLEYWLERRLLIVPGLNEIRTFALPDLRSGPLYRVLGINLTLVTLDASGLALVGQGDALALIHLGDAPTREGLPVRERFETPTPVVSLGRVDDGARLLALLADDTVHEITLDPLSVNPTVITKAEELVVVPVAGRREEEVAPRTVAPDAPGSEPSGAVGESGSTQVGIR